LTVFLTGFFVFSGDFRITSRFFFFTGCAFSSAFLFAALGCFHFSPVWHWSLPEKGLQFVLLKAFAGVAARQASG
jgi:hypothetical protein